MRFAADLPNFLGALVIGLGFGISYTAGAWLTGRLLSKL